LLLDKMIKGAKDSKINKNGGFAAVWGEAPQLLFLLYFLCRAWFYIYFYFIYFPFFYWG